MTESIKERVERVVSEKLGVGKEKVIPTAHFDTDFNLDSLDQIELMMALEEEFNIEIPNEDVEKIPTVGEAIEYIQKKCPASS